MRTGTTVIAAAAAALLTGCAAAQGPGTTAADTPTNAGQSSSRVILPGSGTYHASVAGRGEISCVQAAATAVEAVLGAVEPPGRPIDYATDPAAAITVVQQALSYAPVDTANNPDRDTAFIQAAGSTMGTLYNLDHRSAAGDVLTANLDTLARYADEACTTYGYPSAYATSWTEPDGSVLPPHPRTTWTPKGEQPSATPDPAQRPAPTATPGVGTAPADVGGLEPCPDIAFATRADLTVYDPVYVLIRGACLGTDGRPYLIYDALGYASSSPDGGACLTLWSRVDSETRTRLGCLGNARTTPRLVGVAPGLAYLPESKPITATRAVTAAEVGAELATTACSKAGCGFSAPTGPTATLILDDAMTTVIQIDG